MNTFLNFGTPADQYAANYGEGRLFSENEKELATQLPRNIAYGRKIPLDFSNSHPIPVLDQVA